MNVTFTPEELAAVEYALERQIESCKFFEATDIQVIAESALKSVQEVISG